MTGQGQASRLAAQQAERHGEAVVDLHLVDNRQIEVVLNHAVRDVRGERGMADHRRARAAAPTFVGRFELRGGADRERRDDVEAEGGRVVVVTRKITSGV